MSTRYWLLKSEPATFGIDDLRACPKKTDHWDGVRNYQARNFMRDDMRVGDMGFFYHSNCKVPGIVGTVKIVRESYPDHTAFDPKSKYYDEKSTKDAPRWFMVDVQFVEKFPDVISLDACRAQPGLEGMRLLHKGNRLSITPVTPEEWAILCGMVAC